MKKENYGFVYIWYDCGKNRKHKLSINENSWKYYIGAHWGTEDDGYICSSNWMRKAYRRRPQDFKRRIVSRHNTKQETFKEEYRLLLLIKQKELGKKYYNHSITSYEQNCIRFNSDYMKNKWSNSRKGKKQSLETINKRIKKLKGQKRSEEFCLNVKKRMEENPPSKKEDVRKKISESNKGKKAWNKGLTKENNENVLKNIKNRTNNGKMKEIMKGMKWFNNGIYNKRDYICPEGFTSGILKLKNN